MRLTSNCSSKQGENGSVPTSRSAQPVLSNSTNSSTPTATMTSPPASHFNGSHDEFIRANLSPPMPVSGHHTVSGHHAKPIHSNCSAPASTENAVNPTPSSHDGTKDQPGSRHHGIVDKLMATVAAVTFIIIMSFTMIFFARFCILKGRGQDEDEEITSWNTEDSVVEPLNTS